MPVTFPRPTRRSAAAVTVGLTTLLVACADGEEPAVTPAETSTPVETPPTSDEATTDAGTGTATPAPGAGDPDSTEDPEGAADRAGIEAAHEVFGSLAQDSLWEQFEECNATGLEGSYECSGPDVGSFQFFDSRSKAASTTQLLTELRSSQVVEDTGRFVVGWSTLGTTAVITVVDNDEGLVMQQLVSSDLVEPDDRIEELGLDNPPGDRTEDEATETTESSETSSETSTTTTSATPGARS